MPDEILPLLQKISAETLCELHMNNAVDIYVGS